MRSDGMVPLGLSTLLAVFTSVQTLPVAAATALQFSARARVVQADVDPRTEQRRNDERQHIETGDWNPAHPDENVKWQMPDRQ